MTNESKRFNFEGSKRKRVKSDNLGGVVHQEDLEALLQELKKNITDSSSEYQPHFWGPIVSISYDKEGVTHYEHFCQTNCVGMFCDRAQELQQALNKGEIQDLMIYRTQFNSEIRIPKLEKIEETYVDDRY